MHWNAQDRATTPKQENSLEVALATPVHKRMHRLVKKIQ